MKVKIISTGKIVEAKRFKDLTSEEIKASTNSICLWDDKDLFVKFPDEKETWWDYMFDSEVKIIEER